MFEKILGLVKQHIGNDPQVSSAIPADKKDAVEREIAGGVDDGLKNTLTAGGIGGMLSSLGGQSEGGISATVSRAVEDRLQGKFGLSQEVIHKITAAIPGIIQKVKGQF